MPVKKKKIHRKKKGHSKVAQAKVDIDICPPIVPSSKTQALLATVARSNVGDLSNMLVHYNFSDAITKTDVNGSTALHLACKRGDKNMLIYLLGQSALDAIIDHTEKSIVGGYAALHLACLANAKECVQILIEHHADVNVVADSPLGETPLHMCCKHGLIECARILIDIGGASLDTRDGFGHNPSFWAYSSRNENMIHELNLPQPKACTAEEYVALMRKRNGNKFSLPPVKAAAEPKKDKKKK